jgi:hypothetical protein
MKKGTTSTAYMANISNLINGALSNNDILTAVEPYGYDETRIREEGLAQYTLVHNLQATQKLEYGERYAASNKVDTLFDNAYATYMSFVRLSRIALKNFPGALHSLRATGERNRSLSGFISDAFTFCDNLTVQPEYLQAVQKLGITGQNIEDLRQKVSVLETAHQEFLKEKGEAQAATVERDKAFDALYNWYSDFRAVLRIALADHPQTLEKLGIVKK